VQHQGSHNRTTLHQPTPILCRLGDAKEEREALIALFTTATTEAPPAQHLDSSRRLQGVAHFLEIIGRAPAAATSIYAWRLPDARAYLRSGARSPRLIESTKTGSCTSRTTSPPISRPTRRWARR
jgi:hypothetical protein